jgi:hypothetical protein
MDNNRDVQTKAAKHDKHMSPGIIPGEDVEIVFDLLYKDEKRVLMILCEEHQGIKNAISMNDLTKKAEVSNTRRLQQIIKDLVEVYGVRVGSGIPAGYFIITNQEEADQVAKNFFNRGISNLRHYQAVKKISKNQLLKELEGQIELPLGESI